MSVLLFLLFIISIVLIILDIRNIIKWKKDKKSMANKLDSELTNNVLKDLIVTDIFDILFKEDKKNND